MSINKYKESLQPVIEKDKVISEISVTSEMIANMLLPALRDASEIFNEKNPKNKVLAAKQDQFFRVTRVSNQGGFIKALITAFENADKQLESVANLVTKNFPSRITKDTITYKEAAYLRYVELVSYAAQYGREILRFWYTVEQHNGDMTQVRAALTPAVLKKVEAQWTNFIALFGVLMISEKEIVKSLENTLDITVSDNEEVVSFTHGVAKINPINANFFISPDWNPIFYLRVRIAEWQADRYRRTKETLRLYEMQKLHLEKRRRGEEDPILEQRIQEVEGIITEIEYKIDKMEKAYA